MLWDPELESWRQLGVTGTPSFALFDGSGRRLDAWAGLFDEARVLDAARRA